MLKYQRWYDQIIDRARGRYLDSYKEVHHIVPRSLGGGDDDSNLVDLTYREHFLVHWLLTKLHTGKDLWRMVYALNCMTMGVKGRVVAGWQFDAAKRAFMEGRHEFADGLSEERYRKYRKEMHKKVFAQREAREFHDETCEFFLVEADEDAKLIANSRRKENKISLGKIANQLLQGTQIV